jgi:hypothetical protein
MPELESASRTFKRLRRISGLHGCSTNVVSARHARIGSVAAVLCTAESAVKASKRRDCAAGAHLRETCLHQGSVQALRARRASPTGGGHALRRAQNELWWSFGTTARAFTGRQNPIPQSCGTDPAMSLRRGWLKSRALCDPVFSCQRLTPCWW